MTKNSEQSLKYLKKEKSFKGEMKRTSFLKDFQLPGIVLNLKVLAVTLPSKTGQSNYKIYWDLIKN